MEFNTIEVKAVRTLIRALGDDPEREGLRDTPRRVLAFYDELRRRGDEEVDPISFDSQSFNDLLIVKGIPFFALCEHHILPFYGVAHVGYIPRGGQIVGLSKVARIVARASAGLSVQELLTHKVAEALRDEELRPDVAVVTIATHLCMVMRGVRAIGSTTTVSVMLGSFRNDPTLRVEFMSLLNT